MTRETKIGLLVGLAFIIVIGILLSDQLMRSTEPPPAQLSSVADTLRRGTTTPASQHRPAAPAVSALDASPEAMVPTRDEITRRPPPVTFVEIRPGGDGVNVNNGNVVIGVSGGNAGNNPNQVQGQQPYRPVGPAAAGQENVIRAQTPGHGGGTRTIADVAAAMGETLVGPDGQPVRASRPIGAVGPVEPVQQQPVGQQNRLAGVPARAGQAAGMKQYTVEPGDSLSRIALKTMGSANKANRDAIVRANPSLAADPNKVIIGVTYNVPVAGNGPAVTPTGPVAERVAPVAPARAAAAENVYVVQPGDNLTRIAKEQMGDTSTIAAIKELNKDVVKNWDVLLVGTKLRMPGRTVASVQ
jgi:LysM repeat protein